MYRSEHGLYHALAIILRQASEPLTCTQIYDNNPNIRTLAKSVNRVSDYLGGLYRKGDVKRVLAPREDNSSARWAYVWNKRKDGVSAELEDQANEFVGQFRNENAAYQKPNLEIFDEGKNIRIELPSFTITIRQKH